MKRERAKEPIPFGPSGPVPPKPLVEKPIKVPNPPEDQGIPTEPETPKVGSRDAPGG
jgi:hypothetical protein